MRKALSTLALITALAGCSTHQPYRAGFENLRPQEYSHASEEDWQILYNSIKKDITRGEKRFLDKFNRMSDSEQSDLLQLTELTPYVSPNDSLPKRAIFANYLKQGLDNTNLSILKALGN